MSDPIKCPFCGNLVRVFEQQNGIIRGGYLFEHIPEQKNSCEMFVGILMPDWNEKYEREAIEEYNKRV